MNALEIASRDIEIARHTLASDFEHIDPRNARVILFEGTDRVLPTYPPSLSQRAERSLARLGVAVRTRTMVRDVGTGTVTMATG